MDDADKRLRLAFDAAGIAIWDSTIIGGRIEDGLIDWSPEGAALIGFPAVPVTQPYKEFLAMVEETDRQRVLEARRAGVALRDRYNVRYRIKVRGGDLRWLEAKARIVCDDAGEPVRTLGMVWDITERMASDAKAAEREQLAEITLRAIGDAVIRIDAAAKVTFMNRAAESLTAWESELAMGLPVEIVLPLVNEVDGSVVEHAAQKCLRQRHTIGVSNHTQLINRDGRCIDVEDAAAPIWSNEGDLVGAVLVIRDVSHERRLAQQMTWQAKHDALTGLINRAEFELQLNAALYRSKQEGQVHAVLYMDLDRFKVVNDTCGHAAGDVLLQLLCKLLHAEMRDADILARLGGDELGALLLNCPLERACSIGDVLRRAVNQIRFAWDEHTFDVGVSIGVVEVNAESVSSTEIMVSADQACYLAKEQGRDRVQVYRESDLMLAQKKGELRWLTRLHEALDKRYFKLFAMPIVSLGNEDDQHEEILLRMTDATGRLVLPGAFIPAAERYDLMHQVDRWVVHALCSYLATRPAVRRGSAALLPEGSHPAFAINLSGRSLGVAGFCDFIVEEFAAHAVSPQRICFEITETAVISNLPGAREFMERLRALGCRFSLDDFGSGLSSFGYLRTLPVDYLKIDGIFIRDIATNPVNQALVRAINEVGHVMKIKTVAEYVEDAETLALVRAIGIDYAQGLAVGPARSLEVEST